MITVDGDGLGLLFPYNAVNLIRARMTMIDPDLYVCGRRLVVSDPIQAVGVTAATWSPDNESQEFRGSLALEPTIQRYTLTVQCLIKHADEEMGAALHGKLSKIVRGLLLTDEPLAASLRMLSTSLYGVRERTSRWQILSQRFLSEELSGQFIYLSSAEVQLETENTRG